LTETAVREWVKQAELDTVPVLTGCPRMSETSLPCCGGRNRRLREDVEVHTTLVIYSKAAAITCSDTHDVGHSGPSHTLRLSGAPSRVKVDRVGG
jgi:hypothetical protein